MGEQIHDKIGQALVSVFQEPGLTLQELDLDNLGSQFLSEFFLDPNYCELLSKVAIRNTRSEGGNPRQIFTISPGAQLQQLNLNQSFDLRTLPANDQTRLALDGLQTLEVALLSAQDLFSQHIMPRTIA